MEQINTSLDAVEPPVVERLKNKTVIKKRLTYFEDYVNRLVTHISQNTPSRLAGKITLANWILINLVVIAYFAGKANAQTLTQLTVVYENYKIIGLSFIIANLTALIVFEVVLVLKIVARIVLGILTFILLSSLIFWGYKKVMK